MQTIKIKSLYPPTIVNFPTGGRYVVSGSNWISVNDDVTMNDVKWIPYINQKKVIIDFIKKSGVLKGLMVIVIRLSIKKDLVGGVVV